MSIESIVKVLQVDDEQQVNRIRQAFFAQLGWQCTTEHSAQVTIEKLLATEALPDILISDLEMLGSFDGIEVVNAAIQKGVRLIILNTSRGKTSEEVVAFLKEHGQLQNIVDPARVIFLPKEDTRTFVDTVKTLFKKVLDQPLQSSELRLPS